MSFREEAFIKTGSFVIADAMAKLLNAKPKNTHHKYIFPFSVRVLGYSRRKASTTRKIDGQIHSKQTHKKDHETVGYEFLIKTVRNYPISILALTQKLTPDDILDCGMQLMLFSRTQQKQFDSILKELENYMSGNANPQELFQTNKRLSFHKIPGGKFVLRAKLGQRGIYYNRKNATISWGQVRHANLKPKNQTFPIVALTTRAYNKEEIIKENSQVWVDLAEILTDAANQFETIHRTLQKNLGQKQRLKTVLNDAIKKHWMLIPRKRYGYRN